MIKLLKRGCRTLFSRYTISAVLIGIELALLLHILFADISGMLYLVVAILLTAIPASLSLINKDANPEYKVPWIFIVWCIPLFGPLIYVIFYKRRMSRKETRQLNGIFGLLSRDKSRECDISSLSHVDKLAAGKAAALIKDSPASALYKGTSSEFFVSGEQLFDAMLVDLREAKKYIFLEYFIIDEGELWDEILEILKEKARDGVDVRVLYDDIGCMKTLPAKYPKILCKQGIKTRRFNEVNPRVSSIHQNRDHRKICVVDGRVGYTGGVNIADEYANRVRRFGYWKDGGIRLEGLAVEGIVRLFLSNWDYSTHTVSDYEAILSEVKTAKCEDGGYYLPFGSGPAPVYKRQSGKNAILNIINQSEEYVYITTPYLIMDYDLTEALCNASYRGVDIRIITPGIADKKLVKVLTKSSYRTLLDAGIKIYEYRPGFIHEKTLVSDDKYAIIGTINLDYRSLVHHFENAVWIYGAQTVVDARDGFLSTINDSEKMDKKKSRLTLNEWAHKIVVRLFAPLL